MRLRPVAILLALAGCSTLEPKTEPQLCANTADCADEPGTVCQFGFCLPAGNTPPQVYVGIDLRERTQPYRVEIAGCDNELTLSQTTGVNALEVPRSQLTMLLDLRVFKEVPADPKAPTLDEMLQARFVLTQGSRFARDRVEQNADAPTTEGDDVVVATSFRWPRYHPDKIVTPLPDYLQTLGHILWRIEPTQVEDSEEPTAAPRYLNLTPAVAEGLLEDTPVVPCFDDLDCCPPGLPCEQDDVDNACVPAGLGIDGVTSGVCRRQSTPLFSFDHVYADQCNRKVVASIQKVHPDSFAELGGIEGATLALRHADRGKNRVGLAALAVPEEDKRPRQCIRDDACVEGLQFCDTETEQCMVDLNGLRAASGTADEMRPDRIETRVFTYCEHAMPGVPVPRSYTMRLDPPAETGLPPVNYAVDVEFLPGFSGDPDPDVDLGGGKKLCVPDWGAPLDVQVKLVGMPMTLLTANGEDFVCCSLDCLPTTDDAEPPPVPTTCAGAGTGASAPNVEATTTFKLTTLQQQQYMAETSMCVPPVTDEEGVVSTLTRAAECGDKDNPDVCVFASLPGNPEQRRTYNVRITPPTGSVLGSAMASFELSEPLGGPLQFVLPQREIVRGRVTLGSEVCSLEEEEDDDCGSEGATVLAERLRIGNETEATTPGPYFHEVSTFTDPERGDGFYVLPLDPGVWVMTALPDAGTAGGPALLTLVGVEEGQGTIEQNFTLEQGILVTMDVDSFDRRSTVLPLDIGSWRFQTDLLHPDRAGEPELADRLLDLMRPGECLTASGDGTTACQIRRLVSGTSLTPSQVGQVRFTARDLGKTAATVCSQPGP